MVDHVPSIIETLREWHLTKMQAKFAVLILDHFHKAEVGKNLDQLLALYLGALGIGKLQTMFMILWYMSQNRQ